MRSILMCTLAAISISVYGQSQRFTIDEAIDFALTNSAGMKASEFEAESQRQMKKTSFDLPKTEISLLYGQYNSFVKNDNNITVTQSIPFSSLGSQGRLNHALIESAELSKASTANELIFAVKQTYFKLAFAYSQRKLLREQDSLFGEFYRAASLRYEAGETNLLEKTTADVQRNEAGNKLRQVESDIHVLRTRLGTILNASSLPDISLTGIEDVNLTLSDSAGIERNPELAYHEQQIEVASTEKKLQRAKAAPDLLVGFFTQTLNGTMNPETGALASGSDRFVGFQAGISIPLWFAPHHGRIRAADFAMRAAGSRYVSRQKNLSSELEQAVQSLLKNRNSLEYFRNSALPNADLILRQSLAGFRGGDVGYTEYLLGVRNAMGIRESYLETLDAYNQSIIYIEFLSGNKQ